MNLNEETQILLNGDFNLPETKILADSWFAAIAMQHKLPDEVRFMPGMSGKKYRYLINTLVEKTPNAKYLEVGSYLGSTACSAIFGNEVKATCVDNWSQNFGHDNIKEGFLKNTSTWKSDKVDFDFIESDFRKLDHSTLGKYNIYMFDGPHEHQDQYDGVFLFDDVLEDTYTLIVDDWNLSRVREGTLGALKDLGHDIIANIQIITRWDGVHPEISGYFSDWHNGYFIAVIKKP